MKPCDWFGSVKSGAGILLLLIFVAICQAQDFLASQAAMMTALGETPKLTTCSQDGAFFATAMASGRINYWRAEDRVILRTLHQCHPRAMAFSPDGNFLAIAGGSNGCPARLKVWRLTAGTVDSQIETELGSVPIVNFSSDGRLLVSTGEDFRINVWELPSGTLISSNSTSGLIAHLDFEGGNHVVVVKRNNGVIERFPVP